MAVALSASRSPTNLTFETERMEMAAAFRWTARLGMHEAVANHFSLAVSENGRQFLINPNQQHFSRIKASDLLLLSADDPETMDRPDAPDPTAWGLHGAIHRLCPHARCVMHVHSIHATVLACLKDSTMLPIDQSTAMFYNRTVIDEEFSGLAFENEGERCANLLQDPAIQIMIMGNHGVLVLGNSVAEAFNRLYYFERAAQTYVLALQTGKELRVLSDEIAEKTAAELENYPGASERHLAELIRILDDEGSDFRS